MNLPNQVRLAEEPLPPGGSPGSIDHLLATVRLHLRMEIAFVSNVGEGQVTICNAQGNAGVFAIGDQFPEEESYCKRVIDGRIPYLIQDTAQNDEVAGLAATLQMPIGSHLSVPVILSNGEIYGTFCCFSSEPNPALSQRDVQMMHAFAALASVQIEIGLGDATHRQGMVERINATIHSESISIVYQPIYDLDKNAPIAVECLARFCDRELRSPDKWFAEAAEVGLGVELELSAITAALRGVPYLPGNMYFTINASPEAIVSGRLAEALAHLPPNRVVIEVTEHAFVADYVGLRQALEPLREFARIAIDDAGAGVAGFRHILDIHPDIIKLDMSLTRGIDSDPGRAALASALVAYGREIGSMIVAEGIETTAELNTLRKLGVGFGQGYFLCRPMPIARAAQFLLARNLQFKEPH